MAARKSVSLRSSLKFVATQNPFYLISACLVLLGLHKSFTGSVQPSDGWMMTAIFFGYATLLVLAATVVVRFGVWEDARMILLIVVLLFVTISNSYDGIVNNDPTLGTAYLMLGLVFAVALSETALRLVRIRLPAAYRVAYYIQLTLMFVYPAVLAHLLKAQLKEMMAWQVLLFPVAAALAMLSLWPAARRVGLEEPPNGTPWRWPLYPWTLFFFTGLGLMLRSYSLSVSFEVSGGMETGFQGYFLVPMLLAVAILLLEIGIANRNRPLQSSVLLWSLGLMLLSLPGLPLNEVQARFMSMLQQNFGSPTQITIAALLVFYLAACARRVRYAEFALCVCLMASAFVDSRTVDLRSLAEPHIWPLAILAAYQVLLGILHRDSSRVLLATAVSLFLLSREVAPINEPGDFWFIALTTVYGVLFATGLYCDDNLARRIRHAAPTVLALSTLCGAIAIPFVFPGTSASQQFIALSVLLLFAVLYWLRLKTVPCLSAAIVSLASIAIAGSMDTYLVLLERGYLKGLTYLAWGMSSLVAAFSVSLLKGGVAQHLRNWMARLNAMVHGPAASDTN